MVGPKRAEPVSRGIEEGCRETLAMWFWGVVDRGVNRGGMGMMPATGVPGVSVMMMLGKATNFWMGSVWNSF